MAARLRWGRCTTLQGRWSCVCDFHALLPSRNDWRSEVASTGVVEVLRQLTINPNVRQEVQRQASNLLRRFSTEAD